MHACFIIIIVVVVIIIIIIIIIVIIIIIIKIKIINTAATPTPQPLQNKRRIPAPPRNRPPVPSHRLLPVHRRAQPLQIMICNLVARPRVPLTCSQQEPAQRLCCVLPDVLPRLIEATQSELRRF